MSNRLTFSLASLIFLIAFGLVFAPVYVMAHNNMGTTLIPGTTVYAPHSHPLAQQVTYDINGNNSTDDEGETVAPHGDHPRPTFRLAKADNVSTNDDGSTGNEVVVSAVTTDNATANTFKVEIDFGMDVSDEASDPPTTIAPAITALAADDFRVYVLNNDKNGAIPSGATISAPTRKSGSNSIFETTVTVVSGALPTGTADDVKEKTHLRILMASAGQVYSLQHPAGSLLLTDGTATTNAVNGSGNYATPSGTYTDFTMVAALTPTLTIGKVEQTKGMATVPYTLTGNTDATVTPMLTVVPASAASYYSVAAASTGTAYVVTQKQPTVFGMNTPAAMVTLALTPAGGTAQSTSPISFPAREFDAADFDKKDPFVVIGDVADDKSAPFDVRFTITDMGNADGTPDTNKASGFPTDKDGNITGIKVDLSVLPAIATVTKGPTEVIPARVVDTDTGDVISASFAMEISPSNPQNRVPLRIDVKVKDRAGNEGTDDIRVTLGPTNPLVPTVTSSPNIISCLTGSTITVKFNRELAAGQKLEESDITLSNPDSLNPVADNGWVISSGTFTFANGATPTATFKVMPKSDRSWLGQTRLKVDVKAKVVEDLGANLNKTNAHDVVKEGTVVKLDPDAPFTGIPLRKGTFTIGPVLKIAPSGYIAVAREKENPFVPGQSTLTLSHLGDTTLVVADKNVRAEYADVQGWECMPDLGVLLGIAPYRDEKENDRGSGTFLAVTGGGGIIVKESPEQRYINKVKIAKGTVGISEMMWAVDRSKLFGAASNVEQAQEQWIELHNLNAGSVYVTLFDLVRDEVYETYGDLNSHELDRMSNYNSATGAPWAIRTDGYTKGRDGDSDYGRDFVAMQRVSTPTATKNYAHKDIKKGTSADGWKASQAVYLTRTSRLALVGAYNLPYPQLNYDFIGTPARKNSLVDDRSVRTTVERSPFVINEIGNDTGGTNDWVELRNVTDEEQSLKNYQLSVVTSDKKDTQLFHFHDKDYKVPANGVILVASTSPENTDIAAGVDVARSANDQDPTGVDTLYVVRSFDLPDSGQTLLILRKSAKSHEKQHLGTDKDIIDVVGTLKIEDPARATRLWPLKATGAPHGNVIDGTADEDFRAGKVYQRNDAGGGTGEKDFAVRGYTGIGYDRVAAKSDVNGGTPGYDNGAHKEYNDANATKSAAPVTISEIMLDVATGRRLPQWIELYNSSMTSGVNLNGWKLSIENANDVDTALNATITLGAYTIAPNQTVLIVTTSGRMSDADHFPNTRVINLWTTKAHRDALQMENRNVQVFSKTGFYFELVDKAGKLVDEVGNLDGNRRTREEPTWALPMGEDDDRRSSLIRRYDRGTASDGTMAGGWISADTNNFLYAISDTYYGDPDDFGTPGFRGGGPLPVSLSKFRPERLDDGSIVVRWITESELNNAGFNILRSETKDGEYTKLNTQLIKGQGTTSERTTYAFPDTSAKPNVVYYYLIQDVSLDGEVTTLRVNRLKGHISAAGKATTTWGELKALQ